MTYILLPVHNRKVITKRFIKCLLKQTSQEFQLIIIDDGSKDGTAEMVCELLPNTIVIRGNGKLWWGGSLDKGFKWIKKNKINPEFNILIINDDVEVESNFLNVGQKLLNQNPRTLILAQDYSRNSRNLIDRGSWVDWHKFAFYGVEENHPINILSTRGLFFKVKDFLEIGGFRPLLIPHYQSDYEFTHRAYRKGFALKTFSELRLIEDTSQTGIREEIKGLKGFLRTYFSKKSNHYYPSWVAFIILSCPWRYKLVNLFRVSIFIRVFRIIGASLCKWKIIDFITERLKNFYLLLYHSIRIFFFLRKDLFTSLLDPDDIHSLYSIGNSNGAIYGFVDIRDDIRLSKNFSFFYFEGEAIDPSKNGKVTKRILITHNGKILGYTDRILYRSDYFRSVVVQAKFRILIPNTSQFKIAEIELYSMSADQKTIFKLPVVVKN